ncbi:hypothetical protein [Nocardia sp. NPDC050717]|uniref:hypothetical protein n=1 Tax=Nocardia sp. NPDC050717 TaxID=3157221 RepID=UPI003410250A
MALRPSGQRALAGELAGLAGSRALAAVLLPRGLARMVGGTGAVRELPRLTGQLYAGKFTRPAGLRRATGPTWPAVRRFAGAEHIAWSPGIAGLEGAAWVTRSTLWGFAGAVDIAWSPGTAGRKAVARTSALSVPAGQERVAGSAGSGRIAGHGPWVLAESTAVAETLPGAVAIGRTVRLAGLTGHGQTRTGLPRLTWPLERRLTRPRPGDIALPGRHPTLPRRDGRVALRRSVAIIVVVVPMSGIIVAHHASCTRRNPRCPPVR